MGSASVHGHRYREIQIFAEPVESGMDFRQACTPLEYKSIAAMLSEITQQYGAEVVLFDEPRREAGTGDCIIDGLTKECCICVEIKMRGLTH